MEVSKSYTQDTFSAERREMFRDGYKEVFSKKKSVKKIDKRSDREKVRDGLSSMWLDYINGKLGEGTFSECIIDYVLSREFYKKLDRIHSKKK